ncbi:MAG TPA: regulatory protein GemA [Candidatus Competibacter sp.]|nr:regulatory protein GemA [Candidatus Competibacter sp.]
MPDLTRTRDLKLIHIARKDMAWDETTYRAILERVTGKDSAAGLNARQRKAVIDEFVRLGWRVKSRKGHRRPGAVPEDRQRLIYKIGAYLAEAGRAWAYADGIARRVCKVDSLRFCTPEQLHKIVAALAYDQKRRLAKAAETPPEVA